MRESSPSKPIREVLTLSLDSEYDPKTDQWMVEVNAMSVRTAGIAEHTDRNQATCDAFHNWLSAHNQALGAKQPYTDKAKLALTRALLEILYGYIGASVEPEIAAGIQARIREMLDATNPTIE